MAFSKGDKNINRNGRPVGSISVVSALKKKLDEYPKGDKKTYLEQLVKKILNKSIKDGDTAMIKDIIDRVDGKAKESMDLTSKGERLPVLVKFIDGKPEDYINPD